MIIEYSDECTGCGACAEVCPTKAIIMGEKKYGFVYPQIDTNICINCGKCDTVCHLQNEKVEKKSPVGYFALQLKDFNELNMVSSGGAFYAFARIFLERGGVVYGAIQKNAASVQHIRVNSIEQLKPLCRSKYLQSDIKKTFSTIKSDLKDKEVLFCGTPCQTNAIIAYLGEKPQNLFLCDIVCHGVPSPLAFKKYCSEIGKKNNSTVEEIVYRDKSLGWKNNQYSITFKNDRNIKQLSELNPFHGAYLQGLLYRTCCESCRYAALPRISDVVIADFWKYDGKFREVNRGVSLVVSYSPKGTWLLNECKDIANIEKTTERMAIESCRHLTQSPKVNKNRTACLNVIEKRGFFKSYYRFAFYKIIIKKLRRVVGSIFLRRLH